ncbi:hypothetical protein EXIGLDRAFT_350707 [Exidia glandulosa HHB12029]|uniref:Uncharacterized protein n=1 Tax=Exidia glandulosa HHB12029 TaxID=1314781 RepID=A0A165ZFP3_EXIGL|nr:hypothetical protein EXIGLDRAFT_350707 [Exidia glandulosa HHB12029]
MFESASATHEPDTSSAPRGACYITQNLYFATLSPSRASGREDYLSSRPSPKSTRADSAHQSAHSGCSRAAHSRIRGRARRRTLCDMRSAVACDATKPLPSDHPCRQDPQSEPAFDIEADGCPVDLALRGLNCHASPASDQRRANLDASSSGSAVTRSLSSSNTVARLAPAYVRPCTKHCAQDCPSQSGLLSDQVPDNAGSSLGLGSPTACGSFRSTHDVKARKALLPASPPVLPSSSLLGVVDPQYSVQSTHDYVTHARITATGLNDSPSSGAHGAQGHHKIWPLTSQRPASTTSPYHYNLPVHSHTSTYSPDPFLDHSPSSAHADTLVSHSAGSTTLLAHIVILYTVRDVHLARSTGRERAARRLVPKTSSPYTPSPAQA